MTNIFRSLISGEDSITTLLTALCEIKQFRDIVVRLFTNERFGANDIEYNDFSPHQYTRSPHQNASQLIPDITINNGRTVILVEIKTSDSTILTPNQPRSYLDYLTTLSASDKFFVFLTPPNYSHTDKCREKIQEFAEENPNHGIEFIELSWLDILNRLQDEELANCCSYARDFEEVIEERYSTLPIQFTFHQLEEKEMYSKDAASGVTNLFICIDKVSKKLEDNGQFVLNGYKLEKTFQRNWWRDDGEYGFYVKSGDSKVLWFGLWTHFWLEDGTPLTIGVDKRWPHQKEFQGQFPNSTKFDSFLLYRIDRNIMIGDAEEGITKKIMDYLNMITNSTCKPSP